ncbi:peroxidase 29-like [Silene latifolia]|uniref:peroxidase 29-like n=1 Tax=Silene latifolia TaxID=37657 RepID=UPI003D782DE5
MRGMEGKFAMIVQLVILLLVIHGGESEGGELVYNYYETTCPFVEDIVRNEMLSIFVADVTAPAAFLRLLFHDCQVQGCDASILLASPDSEIHASRNLGIRKLEAINQIKSSLEATCPGQVSCADIIALAAKNSVALSGGPFIRIPLGRKDSNTSSSIQADALLPSVTINVDQLISIFAAKGMNLQETVAILGAHTLGAAHCVNVVDRLYKPKPTDHMDLQLQIAIRAACANTVPAANMTLIPNDATPTIFDTSYYFGILAGRGLFSIDSSISVDPRTMVIATQFAADRNYFFRTFSSAFIKLASDNVLTGNMGQVRKQCNRVN